MFVSTSFLAIIPNLPSTPIISSGSAFEKYPWFVKLFFVVITSYPVLKDKPLHSVPLIQKSNIVHHLVPL